MGNAGSIIRTQIIGQEEETLHDAYNREMQRNHISLRVHFPIEANEHDVQVRAADIAFGLIAKGVHTNSSPCIGIYFQTALEYKISEEVCCLFNKIAVPLFNDMGPAACAYIIKKASIQTIICDLIGNAESLLNRIQKDSALKRIVLVQEPSVEIMKQAERVKVEILSFIALEARQ